MNQDIDEIDFNQIEESDNEEVYLSNSRDSHLTYSHFTHLKQIANQSNTVSQSASNRNLAFNPTMTLKSVNLIRNLTYSCNSNS